MPELLKSDFARPFASAIAGNFTSAKPIDIEEVYKRSLYGDSHGDYFSPHKVTLSAEQICRIDQASEDDTLSCDGLQDTEITVKFRGDTSH